MDIPGIIKNFVIAKKGRMPETQSEIDEYLDLINHCKRYAEAHKLELLVGKRLMKKWGFKTSDEIKKEWKP